MRIAIVDDHALMRAGLVELLQSREALQIVWSGARLDDLLRAGVEAELLILDLDLGGEPVDPRLIAEAKANGMMILVVSALASERSVRAVARAGVAGFVSKSEPERTLMEAIDCVASGGQWLPADILQSLVRIDADDVPQLTAQELRVLTLYSSGMTVQSVAHLMSLSPATVHFHIKKIRAKFSDARRPSPGQIDLYRAAVDFGFVD